MAVIVSLLTTTTSEGLSQSTLPSHHHCQTHYRQRLQHWQLVALMDILLQIGAELPHCSILHASKNAHAYVYRSSLSGYSRISALLYETMNSKLRRLLDTDLDLALDRFVFECSKCELMFCYPAVMIHSCCYSSDGTFEYTLDSEFKWRSEDFRVVSYRLSSEESA